MLYNRFLILDSFVLYNNMADIPPVSFECLGLSENPESIQFLFFQFTTLAATVTFVPSMRSASTKSVLTNASVN